MNKEQIDEWVIKKRKLEIKYCGRCYIAKEVHPFGYCESCWEKAKKRKRL